MISIICESWVRVWRDTSQDFGIVWMSIGRAALSRSFRINETGNLIKLFPGIKFCVPENLSIFFTSFVTQPWASVIFEFIGKL
jgi:hypothetical protein